jgi:hypothetical protein
MRYVPFVPFICCDSLLTTRLLLVDAIVRGDVAAMKEHFSSCPQDLNAPLNSARETALHVAVRAAQIECVTWLLALDKAAHSPSQARVKLSVFDARNRTPLHYAAYYKVRLSRIYVLRIFCFNFFSFRISCRRILRVILFEELVQMISLTERFNKPIPRL